MMYLSLLVIWMLSNTPQCFLDKDEGDVPEEGEEPEEGAPDLDENEQLSPNEAISAALKNHPMQLIMPTLDPTTGNVYGVVLNDVMLNAFEYLQLGPHPLDLVRNERLDFDKEVPSIQYGSTIDGQSQLQDWESEQNRHKSSISQSDIMESNPSDWTEAGETEQETSLIEWKEEHAAGDDPSSDDSSDHTPLYPVTTRTLPWYLKPQVEYVHIPLPGSVQDADAAGKDEINRFLCHHKIVVVIEELPSTTQRLMMDFQTWGNNEDAWAQPTLHSGDDVDDHEGRQAIDPGEGNDDPVDEITTAHPTRTETLYETVPVYVTVPNAFLTYRYRIPTELDYTHREYRMMRVENENLVEAPQSEAARPRRYRAGRGILHG